MPVVRLEYELRGSIDVTVTDAQFKELERMDSLSYPDLEELPFSIDYDQIVNNGTAEMTSWDEIKPKAAAKKPAKKTKV